PRYFVSSQFEPFKASFVMLPQQVINHVFLLTQLSFAPRTCHRRAYAGNIQFDFVAFAADPQPKSSCIQPSKFRRITEPVQVNVRPTVSNWKFPQITALEPDRGMESLCAREPDQQP